MSTAADVMTTKFSTLSPDMPIADAVRIFKKTSEEEGRRLFGMVVVDEHSQLKGMLSMYDILLLVRPKHIHLWGMMEDIDATGLLDKVCERGRTILVSDIMTTDVITVTPATHSMLVLDLMIKKHIRRVPVVDEGKIKGIVYISDLFYHLLEKLA